MPNELVKLPIEVERLILCPVCGGRRLRIADGGWICPKPGHTGVFHDARLAVLIDQVLPRERDELGRVGATEQERAKAAKRRAVRVRGVLGTLKDLAKREAQG
ncbi:hypothetical protein [Zavarzinella formosa]|uniref:hypothetical protein n=1 Tax=Zavarzinella formosa TaxID=360055 RepID=UPI00030E5FB5|nr:hypothetical protein [Zavarzinella formosa]